jgi:TRAP transporter TAXI family solute receptor
MAAVAVLVAIVIALGVGLGYYATLPAVERTQTVKTTVTTSAAAKTVTVTQTTTKTPEIPPLTQPVRIKIASHGTGSSHYVASSAMSEILKGYLPKGSVVDVLPYSGALGNPPLVSKGDADFAWAYPLSAVWASKGVLAFNQTWPNLSGVAANWDTQWAYFLVTKDSGVKSMDQFVQEKKPLRLAVRPPGGMAAYLAKLMWDALGITPNDITSWGGWVKAYPMGTQVNMFKNRQLDGSIGHITPHHPATTELALSVPIYFLDYPDKVANPIMELGWVRKTQPKGSFQGQEKDANTLGTTSLFFCNSKLPASLVYTVTKAICENPQKIGVTAKMMADWDPKTAWKETRIPLHPGAEAYYKEMGWLK